MCVCLCVWRVCVVCVWCVCVLCVCVCGVCGVCLCVVWCVCGVCLCGVYFGETSCSQLHPYTLKTAAVVSPKTPVYIYQSTRHHTA